ncbi:helix-turn-helix domain-containing protein [Actinosynnema sp. CA-299493]
MLRDTRCAAGLTLRELALRSGYAYSTLSSAEQGRTVPSWPVAEAFVQACGADTAQVRWAWEIARDSAWHTPIATITGISGPVVTWPPQAAACPDRAAELDLLLDLLDPAGTADAPWPVETIVVTGKAGAGKTALAGRLATLVADRYRGNARYIDLCGSREDLSIGPLRALRGLLVSLGVPAKRLPAYEEERIALYREVTAGRRMLLVLDDARDAEQVRPLLAAGHGSLTVVTSRATGTATVLSERGLHLRLAEPGVGLRPTVPLYALCGTTP